MKLSKFINKFIFSIAFICTTVVFFVSIFFQYMSHKKDIQHIKKEFIQYKKNELIKELCKYIEVWYLKLKANQMAKS